MTDPDCPVSEAEVRALLQARKGDWTGISKSADVSHSWLSKFVNGHIENPGIQTLRRVRDAIAANDPAKAKA